MTTLKLNKVGSIGSAEAALHELVTLFTGDNGVGKTTIFRSLRATLLDSGAIITGTIKTDGPMMVQKGTKSGFAQLANGESEHTIQWPSCKIVKPKGRRDALPKSSEWAAGGRPSKTGLLSLFDLGETERLKAFSHLFDADPTHKALVDALKAEGVEDIEVDNNAEQAKRLEYADVWERIEGTGGDWDAAHKSYGEESRTLQGQWKEVTRRPGYGAEIAEDWEAEPDKAPVVEKVDLDALNKELNAKKAEWTKVQTEYLAAPVPGGTHVSPHNCPRCKAMAAYIPTILPPPPDEVGEQMFEILGSCQVHFQNNHLHPYDHQPVTKAEDDRMKRPELSAKLSNLQVEVETLNHRIGLAEGIDAFNEEAAKKDAQDRTQRASDLHWEIGQVKLIQQVLSPTGVRKTCLEATIKTVSEGLTEVASEAELPAITLNEELEVSLGGMPYAGLSESEQWMVRAITMLEIARYDNSEIVLLDRFDVLKSRYQGKMMAAIMYCGVPVVLFMSANQPSSVPDLEAAEMGITYWVDGGTITPLADALAQKEAA